MNNLASKLDCTSIGEISHEFRKSKLSQIANQNYSQAKGYHQVKQQAQTVSDSLLQVAKGIFLELAPDNFDSLSRNDKKEIGDEIFNQFEVELNSIEQTFSTNHSTDALKNLKVFTGGGNWANVKSKIKDSLTFGFNIAGIDNHGAFVVPNIQTMIKLRKTEEDEERFEKQKKIIQEKDLERLTTPQGKIEQKKELLIIQFSAYVDLMGEGLKPEQALGRIEKVEEWLEEKFFTKFGNMLQTAQLMKPETTMAIRSKVNKQKSDFEAELEKAKIEKEGLDDDIGTGSIDALDIPLLEGELES